jgi:hypothetical protein
MDGDMKTFFCFPAFAEAVAGVLLSAFCLSARAANYYVHVGATGSNNGSSWANAWNELNQINWSGIGAGDTIWLAGGTYATTMNISASGSSGNPIYIRRVQATDSVPVAAAGWSSSFDSQVVVNVPVGSMTYGIGWAYGAGSGVGNYVTLDGRVDSGISLNIGDASSTQSWGTYGIAAWHGMTGCTIQYVQVVGPQSANPSQDYAFKNDDAAITMYANPGWGAGTVTGLNINHCRLHGTVNLIRLLGVTSVTIEHNWLYDVFTDQYEHENVVISSSTATGIFRYNNIWNWDTEGILIGNSSGETSESWQVYDNLWHDPVPGGSSRVAEAQYATQTLLLYNNTIVGTYLGIDAGNGGSFSGSSQVRNNILWNSGGSLTAISDCDYDFSSGSLSETHGISGGSQPFVNMAGQDYHLVANTGSKYPRNNGLVLASTYNTDLDGNIRPSSGTWDMGCYEYESTLPTTGAYTYIYSEGATTLTTSPINTQTSGSTILVWVACGTSGDLSAVPMDNMHNTYVGLGMHTFAPNYAPEGEQMYVCTNAAGGTGHTFSFTVPPEPETQIVVIEVENGGLVKDVEYDTVLSPNANTSANVTATGPATLVALWAGDGGGDSFTAVPNNSFNVIQSFLTLSGGYGFQFAEATRNVTAGTYNVTWSETPTEGAHLWMVAVQNSGSSPAPAPPTQFQATKVYAKTLTINPQ